MENYKQIIDTYYDEINNLKNKQFLDEKEYRRKLATILFQMKSFLHILKKELQKEISLEEKETLEILISKLYYLILSSITKRKEAFSSTIDVDRIFKKIQSEELICVPPLIDLEKNMKQEKEDVEEILKKNIFNPFSMMLLEGKILKNFSLEEQEKIHECLKNLSDDAKLSTLLGLSNLSNKEDNSIVKKILLEFQEEAKKIDKRKIYEEYKKNLEKIDTNIFGKLIKEYETKIETCNKRIKQLEDGNLLVGGLLYIIGLTGAGILDTFILTGNLKSDVNSIVAFYGTMLIGYVCYKFYEMIKTDDLYLKKGDYELNVEILKHFRSKIL